MATILVIDDTKSILQLVSLYLQKAGHIAFTADDGTQGLQASQANVPDLIITDVMMPGMDGFDLTRRLRREVATAHTPILILTANTDFDTKIKAFEVGADDFMSKPFDEEELVVRVNVLLRRAAATAALDSSKPTADQEKLAHVIAVHSLRGGVGCSTLAVNIAVGLAGLWDTPVLLADFVTVTGQSALMLNMPLKRTWADLTHIPLADLAVDELNTVITPHSSGLSVLMAPTNVLQSEHLTNEHVDKMLYLLRPRFGFIVADLTHDFNDIAIKVLDRADTIVLVLAPDLASIRAAAATLEVYKQLEYPPEKIFVVMNWTFERQGFSRQEIQEALQMPVSFVMPFAPVLFVSAINRGMPPLFEKPLEPMSAYLEDLAYRLTPAAFQTQATGAPKPALKRTQKRHAATLQGK
jgi:pilus assembly protein CpaE